MDYTIKENRLKALNQLEQDLIKEIKGISNDFDKPLKVVINQNRIEIGLLDEDEKSEYYNWHVWGSDFSIYSEQLDYGDTVKTPVRLSHASGGSFDISQTAPYYRIIHAAALLKNWDKTCEIVNHYCKAYKDLQEEIFKQNEK